MMSSKLSMEEQIDVQKSCRMTSRIPKEHIA